MPQQSVVTIMKVHIEVCLLRSKNPGLDGSQRRCDGDHLFHRSNVEIMGVREREREREREKVRERE